MLGLLGSCSRSGDFNSLANEPSECLGLNVYQLCIVPEVDEPEPLLFRLGSRYPRH